MNLIAGPWAGLRLLMLIIGIANEHIYIPHRGFGRESWQRKNKKKMRDETMRLLLLNIWPLSCKECLLGRNQINVYISIHLCMHHVMKSCYELIKISLELRWQTGSISRRITWLIRKEKEPQKIEHCLCRDLLQIGVWGGAQWRTILIMFI